MSVKSPILVVVGPTASGKSELAVKIAQKINGEIISADSRQVYQGLDIGTAKVGGRWQTKKIPQYLAYIRDRVYMPDSRNKTSIKGKVNKIYLYKNIPHYCVDFVSPKKTYSAGEFKKCAQKAIQDILSRGKVPIIVGGTGFWIDALIYNLNLPKVPPDLKLRKKLEKKTPDELYKILKKLDPRRTKAIEKQNPRRLIRAIEIAQKLGCVPFLTKTKLPYPTFWIGLAPPQKILEKNIARRARRMINQGLMQETSKLLKAGVSKKRIREFGFEYKAVLAFLESKLTKKELLVKLICDTFRYAQAQMKWFGKNKDIKWFADPKKAFFSSFPE